MRAVVGSAVERPARQGSCRPCGRAARACRPRSRARAMPESPRLPVTRASRAAFPLRFLLPRLVPSPFAFLRFISPGFALRRGVLPALRPPPLRAPVFRAPAPPPKLPRDSFPFPFRSFLHASGRAGRITPLRLRSRRLPAPVSRRLHAPERPKITDVSHLFPLLRPLLPVFSQICFFLPGTHCPRPRRTLPNCTFSPDFFKNTAGISPSFRRKKRVSALFSFLQQSTQHFEITYLIMQYSDFERPVFPTDARRH